MGFINQRSHPTGGKNHLVYPMVTLELWAHNNWFSVTTRGAPPAHHPLEGWCVKNPDDPSKAFVTFGGETTFQKKKVPKGSGPCMPYIYVYWIHMTDPSRKRNPSLFSHESTNLRIRIMGCRPATKFTTLPVDRPMRFQSRLPVGHKRCQLNKLQKHAKQCH